MARRNEIRRCTLLNYLQTNTFFTLVKTWPLYLLLFLAAPRAIAQGGVTALPTDTTRMPQGAWARLEVENGDSIFIMSLNLVRVVARRKFANFAEQRQYYLYWRAARKVYPYALQAISLYEEIEAETKDMNKRQRRRYLRKEQKELKEDFKEQMKKLSRTEGKVLIKMVEKETNKSFFNLIKETRGGFTATYWHNLGKLWDYDLKNGYQPGADPLLDEIFLDYDFGRPDWWN